jgi:two-component system, OmpR family, response regulator
MTSRNNSPMRPESSSPEIAEFVDVVSRGQEILRHAHAVGQVAEEKLCSLLRNKENTDAVPTVAVIMEVGKRMVESKRCLRVLLVEDHAATAKATADLLKMYGYMVTVATDGQEAVEAAKLEEPDLILLDIGLPKKNGYEVANQLRNQLLLRRPLVVAVSAYGADDRRERCAESGIDLFLAKPVDPEQLHVLLDRFQRILVG